ncbi:hypothetical protein PR202_gb04785 [Eleusine coracana subsp. coracana]|uniref:Homeobox domain-containing protein n=1 Tax=Eleusine coracana subsp. coracana TaxID=191504 RepID=A0AAV5E684_ELECO|nr:hypothetical protein PR202_gb04785 [Eleusine coracana subsp. coracana]
MVCSIHLFPLFRINLILLYLESNRKRRRFYSSELKVAIYLELLSKTDPPLLHRGVSKACALKFDVPLQSVQLIWFNGQNGGIKAVKNKYSQNCGRKKVQINSEAIKPFYCMSTQPFQILLVSLVFQRRCFTSAFRKGVFGDTQITSNLP